ncbi:MAG: glycosyltransferase family 2 protein [Actinomyces sp.]|nr:MAG: glycosyltransferase family 2 protein [Actinomyces sp.]
MQMPDSRRRHAGRDDSSITSIGVVVVTHCSAPVLTACLDSLQTASRRSLRCVVVDNDSDDDSVAIASDHPVVDDVVATGVNAGYAAGVNRGIEHLADADAVVVLNPDCRVAPGALDHLADRLGGTVGVTVPRLVTTEGATSWSLYRRPTIRRALGDAVLGTRRAGRRPSWGEQETRPESYLASHPVDWASGAALMISRACLEATGAWDESYFLYSEETDFCLRTGDAGFRIVYVPEAVVTHIGGDSPHSDRLWSLLVVNKVRLYRRRHGRVAGAVYGVVVTANEALRALSGRRPSRAAVAALLWPPRRRRLRPPRPPTTPDRPHRRT